MNVFVRVKLLPGLNVVLLLTLVAAGCSHGTLSELPTAPAPTVRSLVVTPVGGGTMIEGGTVPITSSGGFDSSGPRLGALAQYTDGSAKYVEATWTSSDTKVVAIESGNLTAKGRGTATVTAAAVGRTASETFVVQGGIAGTWAGTLLVEQCGADSGALGELVCFPPNQGRPAGVLAVGTTPPISLQITKTDTDLRAAAQFGDLRGTLTGSDRGANFMTFNGEMSNAVTNLKVMFWDARVQADAMEGTIAFEIRVAGQPGHAEVVTRIDKVTRR